MTMDISVETNEVTVTCNACDGLTIMDAEALMRELDARLNPWGAPGEIPTERGPYWRALDDGRVLPCDLGAWGWISSQGAALARRELQASRFRRRWTPAAPEVAAG